MKNLDIKFDLNSLSVVQLNKYLIDFTQFSENILKLKLNEQSHIVDLQKHIDKCERDTKKWYNKIIPIHSDNLISLYKDYIADSHERVKFYDIIYNEYVEYCIKISNVILNKKK